MDNGGIKMRFLGNKCIEVWSIEDVEFAAYSIDEPVSKQEAKTVLMYMGRDISTLPTASTGHTLRR